MGSLRDNGTIIFRAGIVHTGSALCPETYLGRGIEGESSSVQVVIALGTKIDPEGSNARTSQYLSRPVTPTRASLAAY